MTEHEHPDQQNDKVHRPPIKKAVVRGLEGIHQSMAYLITRPPTSHPLSLTTDQDLTDIKKAMDYIEKLIHWYNANHPDEPDDDTVVWGFRETN